MNTKTSDVKADAVNSIQIQGQLLDALNFLVQTLIQKKCSGGDENGILIHSCNIFPALQNSNQFCMSLKKCKPRASHGRCKLLKSRLRPLSACSEATKKKSQEKKWKFLKVQTFVTHSMISCKYICCTVVLKMIFNHMINPFSYRVNNLYIIEIDGGKGPMCMTI